MNLEDRKILAAQQYALDKMDDGSDLNKIKDAWLDGFDTAMSLIKNELEK